MHFAKYETGADNFAGVSIEHGDLLNDLHDMEEVLLLLAVEAEDFIVS